MGLTYAQALALGLGHLHPDHPENGGPPPARATVPAAGRRPATTPSPDGMNKTERRFRDHLEAARRAGRILRYAREPIKVRLAGRTWYTPDFAVITEGPVAWLVDVKGHMEDDAAVKIKVAADLYPEAIWLVGYYDRAHGWMMYQVSGRGIGPQPIHIRWIHEV